MQICRLRQFLRQVLGQVLGQKLAPQLALALLLAVPSADAQVAADATTMAGLGGMTTSPFTPPLAAAPLPGRMLEITMNVPGQTWQERFVVGIPSQMQNPAPVLTLFHGYGEDPLDVVNRSELPAEAMRRGWVVFIPLGAHHFNYGIEYAQDNIEDAFEFLGARLPIDMDRIYGVGFSMGGGAAASYAARHLDPQHIRFAALVNHTGTTSLRATYQTSNDTNLFRSPLMFGATPDENPFTYQRSSTVDLDPGTGLFDANAEMARNLSTVPVQNWYAQFDVNQTIIDQTILLHQRVGALGGTTEEIVVQSAAHEWASLDTMVVIDWLEAQTLRAPGPGDVTRTLADRDGRWHSLEIKQRAAGEFTPVLWSSQTAINSLYLINMKNAETIETDLRDQELDAARIMHVITETTDGHAPALRISGFTQAPSSVNYRGRAMSNWSFDAATGTLTMEETGTPTWGHWIIVP